MPSNDIQQAKADMFSEAVYDLENAMVRAIVQPEPDRQVTRHKFGAKLARMSSCQIT